MWVKRSLHYQSYCSYGHNRPMLYKVMSNKDRLHSFCLAVSHW